MVEVRPWVVEDAGALNAALAASREHLAVWLPWASEPPMPDATRRLWIAQRERERRAGGDAHMGVWRDGVLVGAVGLHRRVGPGTLEIGYWTHVDHVRRGVARAAVAEACALAFAEPSVRRVEIHHDVANAASGAVAAAAGFAVVREEPRAPRTQAESGLTRVWARARG